jgi:hypothetical protein
MVMLGYELGAKAYRVFDPVARHVHVARDVIFDVEAQWDWSTWLQKEDGDEHHDIGLDTFTVADEYVVCSTEPVEEGSASVEQGSPSAPASVEPTSPMETTTGSPMQVDFATPPSNVQDYVDAFHEEDEELRFRLVIDVLGPSSLPGLAERDLEQGELLLVSAEEPATFKEAEKNPSWRKAMDEEMKSIEDNKTWQLVDLPAGHSPIGLNGFSG